MYGYHVNLSCSFCTDLFARVSTDPAPVLEASHSLEERLQQLQSSAPDSEALVREISGHWKKHLECLEKTGQPQIIYIKRLLQYVSAGIRSFIKIHLDLKYI